MKHLLVILGGAADEPIPDLGGRTPLMTADTPVLNEMVKRGRVGAVRTMRKEWGDDPSAALFGILGYSPGQYFTGRGPLIASSVGVDMDPRDVAFRLDLVSTDGERLLDPTAGRIGPSEARELVEHLSATLRIRLIQFYPVHGHQNLLVWREGPDGLRCTAPREVGESGIREAMPQGDRSERLEQLMWDSYELLSEHRVNRRRCDEGKPTASMVWPWAPGRLPRLPGFGPTQGMGGAVVADDELVRGLGRLAGLRVLDFPRSSSHLDTDYRTLARHALGCLDHFDFAVLHVSAPNEASLDGDYEAKVDSLEHIDEYLFGTLRDHIGKIDDYRIMVISDHVTSTQSRQERTGWVPLLLSGNLVRRGSQRLPFDERACDEAEWRIDEPWFLLKSLFESDV